MTHSDLVITKRMLGALILLVGTLGFIGVLLLDAIRGDFGDFGPTPLLALVGCLGLCVLGVSLLPLGDRPA